MKRIFTLVMAIVLMLTLTLSATAAEFVESVTNKGAPQLVVIDQLNGKDVVGFITDANGEQLSAEFIECLIITSVAEAETDPDIPEDAKEQLLSLYEELTADDMKLSEVCPALDDIVKEKLGSDKSADDLVIKDFFDITDICDEIATFLPQHGATLDLTFDIGIGAGEFITAMVYVDGEWVPTVNTVNNGDGTVTVVFDKICPVAFLVEGSGSNFSTVSPITSDMSDAIIWGFVMLLSLVTIVALVVYRRKIKA